MSTQLISYASGDGAISFTYVEERFNRDSGCFEQIAIDKFVTRADIEERVKTSFPDHLVIQFGEPTTRQQTIQVEVPPKRKRGRPRKHAKMEPQVITMEVPPMFRLCAPVFRVGPHTLRLGDSIYRYTVDEQNIFWTRDGEYTDHNLSIQFLWCIDEEKGLEEPQEVRNVSTRAAIRWFLNHEKTIVQQYPEQDETTAASVDQLREAVQSLQRAGMSAEEIRKLMP